jgi:Concanavalin A-like lectin/glucanases superfamily
MPFAARQGYFSTVVTEANARRVGTSSTNSSLTWTASGVTTSDTQFEFGNASARISTSTSEIQSNSTDILSVGTGDFTVEFWIYIDSLSNHSASCDVFALDTSSGFGLRFAEKYDTNGLGSANPRYMNIFARAVADLDTFNLGASWPIDQWNFVVIQRKSGSFAAWVNGSLTTKTDASSSYNFTTSSGTVNIGTADGGNGVGPTGGNTTYVWIDEFCISNTYRYNEPTENIPVPTAAFTLDSYTTQLLHMDGTNGGTTFTNETS